MNKVLIITYHFPPSPIMASQRPYRLAKYFPQYGWEPIILTAKLSGKPPEDMTVIETEYKDIICSVKSTLGLNPSAGLQEQIGIAGSQEFYDSTWKSKIIKRAKEVIAFPDFERGWYKYAIRKGSEIITREPIDIIISTSPPVISHLIARKLKDLHRKPWVADFRDLWTQNHNYSKMGILKIFERYLEVRTLDQADALVTVSAPLAEKLKFLHKSKKVFCVTNGFDHDEMLSTAPNLNKKFTITYTGRIYNNKMSPSILFNCVAELIKEGKINKDMIEIQFYTLRNRQLIEEITKYKLNMVVSIHDYISRDEVLKKQRESKLLLVLLWNDKNEEGVYTGKIFEYLAARRPIIAVGGPGGVVRNLIEETNSGRYANNVPELKQILSEYYQEYLKNGELNSPANNNIEKYCYKSLAKIYAEILTNIYNYK